MAIWASGMKRGGLGCPSTSRCGPTHCASGTQPLAVWDVRQRGVEAVDMVGGDARVAAQELPTVLAHTAVLHVVILLLLLPLLLALLFVLFLFLLGLPLDPLLLLVGGEGQEQTQTDRRNIMRLQASSRQATQIPEVQRGLAGGNRDIGPHPPGFPKGGFQGQRDVGKVHKRILCTATLVLVCLGSWR